MQKVHFWSICGSVSRAGWECIDESYQILIPTVSKMLVLGIGNTSEIDGVTYYQIEIKLPLRSLSVSRRYTDFVNLVGQLSDELGISPGQFPYQLPPKGSLFTSKSKLITERKYALFEFLNHLIRDRDLQNRKPVHTFLELPSNFKFSRSMFEEDGGNDDDKFVIDESPEEIDSKLWLSYLRQVRSALSSLPQSEDIAARATARENVNKYIQPNIQKLVSSLSYLSQTGEISAAEFSKRTSSLRELLNETERLIFRKGADSKALDQKSPHYNFTKRSQAKDQPVETKNTARLSNKELLAQQQQVHKDQDQEVEQLRKIIARQREISETIGREVEEHNEILDRFNDEVEVSSEKLKDARARAKRIT